MSTATNVATLAPRNNIIAKFADRYSVEEGKVMEILKATAFKQREGSAPATDEQMMALLIVADQYGLNPFTKEIYAYPDKQNGIVPVVGVDGWSRIINQHEALNGVEFRYSAETSQHKGKLAYEWIECVITRKDRSQPIVVREYFDEVVRNVNFATPWDSHPKRMHRHKTLIQCSRIAFGFAGIYDDDEAQRIIEKDITPEPTTSANEKPPVVYVSNEDFAANKPKWKESVEAGRKSADALIAWIESKGKPLTEAQLAEIKAWKAKPVTVEGEAKVVDDPFVDAMKQEEAKQGEAQ